MSRRHPVRMRAIVSLMVLVAVGVAEAAISTPQPDDPAFDLAFPDGFVFSSATAAYQVEGAWNVSGKGENIWDRTAHEHPELILDGSNGDEACDSYHKYKEDIRLAKELGTQMYRFSLSWSRILPTGALDVVNADGLRYYNDVIDECIRNGIEPMVSIYHWDLPQPLQDLGGFPNEVIIDYFEDFAELAFKKFGDRVKWWITFNEPWSICGDGYGNGNKAPAIKSQGRADYLCAHTLLKAHARAYHRYRSAYWPRQKGQVGIAANSNFFFPKNASKPADVAAAQRWQECFLGWYTHPIFSPTGDYPAEMKRRVQAASAKQGLKRSRLPAFTKDEIDYIKGTADFYGINTYTSSLVADVDPTDPDQPVLGTRAGDCGIRESTDPNWETTIASWFQVVPEGMGRLLNWIRTEYDNPKVIVTENGYPDGGAIEDHDRVRYYTLYILEVLKAIHNDGCNVIGYTAWSLMDNYEWFFGYVHKFGLYHVDFADPERPRTPKLSARFYQQLIRTGKVPKNVSVASTTPLSPPTSTSRPAPTAATPTSAPRTTSAPQTSSPSASSASSAYLGVLTASTATLLSATVLAAFLN